MKWVTIFDVHNISIWPGIILGVLLGAVSLALAAGSANCFSGYKDSSTQRFAAFLACVAALFGAFALSTLSDARRTVGAVRQLDAGQADHVEGGVTDVRRPLYATRHAPMLFSFKVGQRWFASPVVDNCNIQAGDRARIVFLPEDGTRVTPLILRMQMNHACSRCAQSVP